MLERIGPLEPGVEHSVQENEIWCRRSAKRTPNTEAAVLPDSLNNHDIILGMVLSKPASELPRISVSAPPGTERVDLDGTFANPGIIRRIEGNNFHCMASSGQRCG